jgi:hypothetical protein
MLFTYRFGPRFVPLSDAYNKKYRDLAKKVASELKMTYVKEGVYVVQSGPCFETVTECRLLRLLGADVTGTKNDITNLKAHLSLRALHKTFYYLSFESYTCIADIFITRHMTHFNNNHFRLLV